MSQKYDVCIVGGSNGKGLLLGLVLSNAGKSVVLYESDSRAFEKIKRGIMPFNQEDAQELLMRLMHKKLCVSDSKKAIACSYFVIICIEPSLENQEGLSYLFFEKYISNLVPFFNDNQHIVVRSPCIFGLTELVKQSLELSGKKTRVSCSPDSTSLEKNIQDLYQLSQIIASCDGKDALQELKKLYALLTDEVIQTTISEAENTQSFYQEHASAEQLPRIQG